MTHRLRFSFLLLAAALVLGYFLRTQWAFTDGQWAAPLDDAWIHFQYARNLASGNGFSYNVGEPTAGSTAPLWTLFLVPPALFTDVLMPWGVGLSAFFWFSSIGLVYYVVQRWFDGSAALVAALGVAVVGRMGWAAWSGMEATAFAAVSLVGIWAYTQYGMRLWVAVFFGLASQLRPEGHALFGLAGMLFCYESWHRGDSFGRILRVGITAVAAYALICLPYALFSLSTTGKPLPNTFYAKSADSVLYSWRTLSGTIRLHWWDNPVAFLLIPFGISELWKRSKLTILWLIGLPLLTPIIIEQTIHHGRYTLPLIPLQIIAATVGVAALANWIGRRTVNQQFWYVVLSMVMLAGGISGLPRWATMLGLNSREIRDIDVAMGEWLRDNTPADALIAVDDIGAIGYISQRRIFDLNGLITPEMWPVVGIPRGLPRNQAEVRLLSQVQPDFLAVFPLWHHELVNSPSVTAQLKQFTTPSRTIIFQEDAGIYAFDAPYVQAVQPAYTVDARFGDAIKLAGYDADFDTGALTLYWESLVAVERSYDVFVHVLDGKGSIVAQADGPPVQYLAPTHLWQPGDIVRDRRQIDYPLDMASGRYTIAVGLYLRETFERLPAVGEFSQGDSVIVGRFERD